MPALKPVRVERVYRGTKFVLEELDTERYDECVEQATTMSEDPLTGREIKETDENLALRFMMRKCVIQPKITDWNALGTRLTRQLERDVRELHFGPEPDEESKRKKALAAKPDADEDDGGGNGES